LLSIPPLMTRTVALLGLFYVAVRTKDMYVNSRLLNDK
jgi:hypothetical protein